MTLNQPSAPRIDVLLSTQLKGLPRASFLDALKLQFGRVGRMHAEKEAMIAFFSLLPTCRVDCMDGVFPLLFENHRLTDA